ncbi:PadR family transcriptional regulator [Nocardiopsis algeriensis]|uniref:DNA-binding PadR family transcriptional regulator n=1 Tax=Nocardiopsis algeriensis TaxID=1478215 RepID=A0A841ITX7_9ACTN|nr:PadR family transcriptional regulator [Nocardiopsis algeriensis]MBB6121690.1 DNA-binding PadR family transcriptional regulator [Nocardiopsis algeriensis]
MSLPHAILTALLEKPSSGLELTRRFDRSIGYFWSATHQQIYRELGKLEESGLIRALPSEVPARGRRKEYEVLPEGRRELCRWVERREDPKVGRDPLPLRLRAAGVVGLRNLVPELARHRDLHLARLREYEEFERRDFPGGALTEQQRVQLLVLRGGIDMERGWVSWLTRAVDELGGG